MSDLCKKAREKTTRMLIEMSQEKGMRKTNKYAEGVFISAAVAFLATGGDPDKLIEHAKDCVKISPFKP